MAVIKIYSLYQSKALSCSVAIIVRDLLRLCHQNRKLKSVFTNDAV